MKDNTPLFTTQSGTDITTQTIRNALIQVGAHECDILYIHSGMSFGTPARGALRKIILSSLLSSLESLQVKTLVFPTFTFSFCNNEPYNRQQTPTPMGALNEYVRKTGKGVRSIDPLLSVYIIGEETSLAENLSHASIGIGSNYDKLHHCGKNVKFLFLGADMRECFTYVHYIEAILGSPYRYNREFTGTIIDGEQTFTDTYTLFSLYANCKLNTTPVVYNTMLERKQLSIAPLGDTSIISLNEQDAYHTICDLLENDPYCLTDGNFDGTHFDTTYNHTSRIVSVK